MAISTLLSLGLCTQLWIERRQSSIELAENDPPAVTPCGSSFQPRTLMQPLPPVPGQAPVAGAAAPRFPRARIPSSRVASGDVAVDLARGRGRAHLRRATLPHAIAVVDVHRDVRQAVRAEPDP